MQRIIMHSSYDGTNLKPYTFAASIVAAGVFVVLCISGELLVPNPRRGITHLALVFVTAEGLRRISDTTLYREFGCWRTHTTHFVIQLFPSARFLSQPATSQHTDTPSMHPPKHCLRPGGKFAHHLQIHLIPDITRLSKSTQVSDVIA